MNKRINTLIGILLLPIVTAIFFWDRVFCVLLFWLKQSDYMTWLNKPQEIASSILRVIVSILILLLIVLIISIF